MGIPRGGYTRGEGILGVGIPGVGGHTKGLGIAEGWVLALFTLLQYRYLVMAT